MLKQFTLYVLLCLSWSKLYASSTYWMERNQINQSTNHQLNEISKKYEKELTDYLIGKSKNPPKAPLKDFYKKLSTQEQNLFELKKINQSASLQKLNEKNKTKLFPVIFRSKEPEAPEVIVAPPQVLELNFPKRK